MFDHLLHITRTYYIHNAIVKPIKPEYRIVDNVYQWTINPTTLIEEISNDDSSLPAPSFSFVPFTKFRKHMDYSALVGKNWNINLINLSKKINCKINSHTSSLV